MLHYKVKPGDKIENIADWYDCTMNDIKKWNHVKSTKIPAGKTLIIYVSNNDYNTYKDVNSMNFEQKQKKIGNNILVSNITVTNTETIHSTPEVANTSVSTEVMSTPSATVDPAPPDTQTKKLESELFVNKEIKKEYVYYTIKPGDTLWTIAQKYPGVTSTELMRLNNMNKSHTLKPGQKIKIKPKS